MELLTAVTEAADLMNQRPLGIYTRPTEGGHYPVLTPNCLLMGKTVNTPVDDASLLFYMNRAERYCLIQQFTREFWKRWAQEVIPEATGRHKWYELSPNLAVEDVVLVHDVSEVKGQYTMAVVEEVKLGLDRKVRSAVVGYRLPRPGDALMEYTGGQWIRITRSIQRLSILLSVEERPVPLIVEGGVVKEGEPEKSKDVIPTVKKKKEKWIVAQK